MLGLGLESGLESGLGLGLESGLGSESGLGLGLGSPHIALCYSPRCAGLRVLGPGGGEAQPHRGPRDHD